MTLPEFILRPLLAAYRLLHIRYCFWCRYCRRSERRCAATCRPCKPWGTCDRWRERGSL